MDVGESKKKKQQQNPNKAQVYKIKQLNNTNKI